MTIYWVTFSIDAWGLDGQWTLEYMSESAEGVMCQSQSIDFLMCHFKLQNKFPKKKYL